MIFFSKANSLTRPGSPKQPDRLAVPAWRHIVTLTVVLLSVSILSSCKEIWLNDPTPQAVTNTIYYNKFITGNPFPTFSIIRIKEDGSSKISIAENAFITSAPKHGKIVFLKQTDRIDSVIVILADADGSNQIRIDSGHYISAELSADASKILLACYDRKPGGGPGGSKDQHVLKIVDVASIDNPTILKYNGTVLEFEEQTVCAFSADGKEVAFFEDNKPGKFSLKIFNTEQSTLSPSIDQNITSGTDLAWSADGTRLLYERSPWKIGIYSPSTGTQSLPPNQKAQQGLLSMDGKELLYSAYNSGSFSVTNLYIIPSTGTGTPDTLTSTTDEVYYLGSFSPDGTRIAYTHGKYVYPEPSVGNRNLSIYDRTTKKDSVVDIGIGKCFYMQ